MKNKVQTLTKKIENIETSKNRFPFGWKYLGRGLSGTYDDSVYKRSATFTECVNFCEKKHQIDGASWNGFTYWAYDQICYCYKNDRSHDMRYPKAVHFRFE